MIVTLTANPSLDRTLEVDDLVRGEVIRASASLVEAGGKGINVARALVGNGHPARAVLPVGGHEGEHLLDLLSGLGIEVVPVGIGSAVRVNVSVVEPGGSVTKLNEAGPRLSVDEVKSLVKATREAAAGTDRVALCGSLPPGAPDDLYETLIAALRRDGAWVAVDASGTPLARSVAGRPDLLKPNREELTELSGDPLVTFGDVVAGATTLRQRGVANVLASLGADGAILVDDRGAWHASAPPVRADSNVGAGDATLAGFLAAGAQGPEALAHGVAWGVAAVQLPGTRMPGPDQVRVADVVVGPVPRDRPLT